MGDNLSRRVIFCPSCGDRLQEEKDAFMKIYSDGVYYLECENCGYNGVITFYNSSEETKNDE